uniref:phosphoinositide 3-kinase adapter protein 1-like n=1 Tax=Myxine glutinosa TaxID=7769 RepID=UPI00358E68EB
MEFVQKEEKVSEAAPPQQAVAAKNQSPLSDAENVIKTRLKFRNVENRPLSKLSGVRALPSHITCGSSTNLHILLKEMIPSVDGVELEFSQPPLPSTSIAAQTVNPYTVCCKAPDLPPGHVEVTIRCNGGELARVRLKYRTQMEELGALLRNTCEPLSFMCQFCSILERYPLDNFSEVVRVLTVTELLVADVVHGQQGAQWGRFSENTCLAVHLLCGEDQDNH